MCPSISIGVFAYSKLYHKLQASEMLEEMFSSRDVQEHLQVIFTLRVPVIVKLLHCQAVSV